MFKHAVLLTLVEAMKRAGEPLRVIETHAGAGCYDLRGDEAQKSKEAEAGVERLMADLAAPAAFDALKAAIRRENTQGGAAIYPGSPLQLIGALGPSDTYIGCELRPDDQQALAALLADRKTTSAKAVLVDGYAFAANAPDWRGKTLVVIDPPFEQGDEYDRIVETVSAVIARGDTLAVWTPIKDLETLDALVSRLEALRPSMLLVGEVRLRPLADPMKMNGCAMILANAADIAPAVEALADWVATHCGDPGGTAKVSTA